MNSEQRKKLRNCLIDQGFKRVQYTNDDGHGQYAEFWERGMDEVTLRWGPRGES